jgi:hypothetical protein
VHIVSFVLERLDQNEGQIVPLIYVCELCILSPSGKFDGKGLAEGAIDSQLGAIKVLRLNVHSESDNWAILSEVSVCDITDTLCVFCASMLTYVFVADPHQCQLT